MGGGRRAVGVACYAPRTVTITNKRISPALGSPLAFAGELPGAVLWEVFWLNVIFKGVVTLVSLPWIYLVKPARLDSTYNRHV